MEGDAQGLAALSHPHHTQIIIRTPRSHVRRPNASAFDSQSPFCFVSYIGILVHIYYRAFASPHDTSVLYITTHRYNPAQLKCSTALYASSSNSCQFERGIRMWRVGRDAHWRGGAGAQGEAASEADQQRSTGTTGRSVILLSSLITSLASRHGLIPTQLALITALAG